MAFASQPPTTNLTGCGRRMDQNFETYFLIWLDASINSEENLAAQVEIRSAINYLQTFDQVDECEKYIRSISPDDRIVFIVSGQFGQDLVPEIHHLRQVFSIYVYCRNKEFHQQWSERYRKVKGVHDELNGLVRQVQSDQSSRGRNKDAESLSLQIFNSKCSCEQSTTGLDGQFLQSQLLISCLLKMKVTSADQTEFISRCRDFYRGNASNLKTVAEFEKDYDPDHCLWWYTRDTFLYRILNKALRIQDVDRLFLMRFFIRDIEKELHQRRYSSPIHLFRGQLISQEELNVLRCCQEKLISISSFMSTSTNPKIALMYVDQPISDYKSERVLFEIDADPRRDGVKPFADISKISAFSEEEEILIMLGSVFYVKNVSLDQNQVWRIQMVLCSDNDCELQRVLYHMRNQYGPTDAELIFFANVLIDMANFDDAEKYLHRLLRQIPVRHPDLFKCYQALGKVSFEKGNYQLSHYYLAKALQTLEESQSDSLQRGYIYNQIGEIYQNEDDLKRASESYKKALNIFRKTFTDDDENLAWCYNNLGIIYQKQENYLKARRYLSKALTIKQKVLPPEHPCLSNTYNNIGNVHYHLEEYDQALEKYQLSYQIFQKSLIPHHPSIAKVSKNIGFVYEAKKDFQSAKDYYQKALDIRKLILSPSHPDLIAIEQDIVRVSLQIGGQSNDMLTEH